jgi:hypothetical protein
LWKGKATGAGRCTSSRAEIRPKELSFSLVYLLQYARNILKNDIDFVKTTLPYAMDYPMSGLLEEINSVE